MNNYVFSSSVWNIFREINKANLEIKNANIEIKNANLEKLHIYSESVNSSRCMRDVPAPKSVYVGGYRIPEASEYQCQIHLENL